MNVVNLLSPEMDEAVFESHADESLTRRCTCAPCWRHRIRTSMSERPVRKDEPVDDDAAQQ